MVEYVKVMESSFHFSLPNCMSLIFKSFRYCVFIMIFKGFLTLYVY